jgi:hypothetical protein
MQKATVSGKNASQITKAKQPALSNSKIQTSEPSVLGSRPRCTGTKTPNDSKNASPAVIKKPQNVSTSGIDRTPKQKQSFEAPGHPLKQSASTGGKDSAKSLALSVTVEQSGPRPIGRRTSTYRDAYDTAASHNVLMERLMTKLTGTALSNSHLVPTASEAMINGSDTKFSGSSIAVNSEPNASIPSLSARSEFLSPCSCSMLDYRWKWRSSFTKLKLGMRIAKLAQEMVYRLIFESVNLTPRTNTEVPLTSRHIMAKVDTN